MHAEPGPSGRDSKDQRGLQETNGMAGGTQALNRDGRKQLPDIMTIHKDDAAQDPAEFAEQRERAIQQIMLDTGYSREKAEAAFDATFDYFCTDTSLYTQGADGYGLKQNETRIISDMLIRMPPYNGGDVYRGIELDGLTTDSLLRDVDVGATFGFAAFDPDFPGDFGIWESAKVVNGINLPAADRDMGVLASFSTDRLVAEDYGGWGTTSSGKDSVLFVLRNNHTAPGVSHLSPQGEMDSEVLSPHLQQFTVTGREVHLVSRPNGETKREVIYYLDDAGLKPKNKGRN